MRLIAIFLLSCCLWSVIYADKRTETVTQAPDVDCPVEPEPVEPPVCPPEEPPVAPPVEEPLEDCPEEEPIAPPVAEPDCPPEEEPVSPPVEEPSGGAGDVEPEECPTEPEPVCPPEEAPVEPPVDCPEEEPVCPPEEPPVEPPVDCPEEEPVCPPEEAPVEPPVYCPPPEEAPVEAPVEEVEEPSGGAGEIEPEECPEECEPQWPNMFRDGMTAHFPFPLPKSKPGLLAHIELEVLANSVYNASTTPVIDFRGNVYVAVNGIYVWVAATGKVAGPFLADHEHADKMSLTPALSPDCNTMYITFRTNVSIIIAVDIRKMLAGVDTADCILWTWTDTEVTVVGSVDVNLHAEADRVLFGTARSWVASILSATGETEWKVNTETLVEFWFNVDKKNDSRLIPHTDGDHCLYLRADGILFKFVKATGELVRWISLTDPECTDPDSKWDHAIMIIGNKDGSIYTASYSTRNNTYGIEADLDLKFAFATRATHKARAPLPLNEEDNQLLWFETLAELCTVYDVMGVKVGACGTTGTRSAMSQPLYSDVSEFAIWTLQDENRKFVVYRPLDGSLLYTVDGNEALGLNVSTGMEWRSLVVDSTGRIFILEQNFLWVFGCPLGEVTGTEGTCGTECRAGYELRKNACYRVDFSEGNTDDEPPVETVDPIAPTGEQQTSGAASLLSSVVAIASLLVVLVF